MPLTTCSLNGKPGYKYGNAGHCYTYTEGDEPGRKKAKHDAIIQGTAVAHSTGENLQLSKEDWEELQKDIEEEGGDFESLIKDDTNNLIFGWGYVTKKADGKVVIDHSEDFVKSENFKDLEMATYAFNLAYREGDIRHTPLSEPATGHLIESMVVTKEKLEKMAKQTIPDGLFPEGVWLGFYFPEDKDYNLIKSMKHPMFSLFGKVKREYVEEV